MSSPHQNDSKSENSKHGKKKRGKKPFLRPIRPPESWWQSAILMANTVRFGLSETFGKWPFGDLVFGVLNHTRRKGNLEVASVFTGSNCLELKGRETLLQLTHFMKLFDLLFLFSTSQFQRFLLHAGLSQEDVVYKGTKAAFLKPAFTIVRDKDSKCFLVLIRGAVSVKDKLTAATGPLVPFHHLVLDKGGSVSKLIMGYAHCGMVVAARCVAKCAIPFLNKAVNEHPDYRIEIVGHSLGAGVAALLAYILRERKEFFSTTAVGFGPAASMTWDLAESGNGFVTGIVNATDVVPSFSAVSVSNLCSKISESSWFTNQIRHSRFFGGCFTNVKSHPPSVSTSDPTVKAASISPVVLYSTEVVINDSNDDFNSAATRCLRSACPCMTTGRRAFGTRTIPDEDTSAPAPPSGNSSVTFELFGTSSVSGNKEVSTYVPKSPIVEMHETDELLYVNGVLRVASVEETNEGECWLHLEKELLNLDKDAIKLENEAFQGTESDAISSVESAENKQSTSSNMEAAHQLYPPGRIVHMVAVPAIAANDDSYKVNSGRTRNLGVYETPRHMYDTIRLSQTMISDHYMPRYKQMLELLIDKLRQ